MTSGAVVLGSDTALLANAGPMAMRAGKFHGALKQEGDREIYRPKDAFSGDEFQKDSSHNLSATGCLRAFFPGARQPSFGKIETVHPGPTFREESVTRVPAAPQKEDKQRLSGCTSMYLQHRNQWTLFKSETVVKNDGVGMALWTGLKDTRGPQSEMMYLQIMYYMAFYEKDASGKWNVVGGLGWGTEDMDSRAVTPKLTVLFPDGRRHSIHRLTTTKDETGKWSRVKRATYTGVWSMKTGAGTPAMSVVSDAGFLRANPANNTVRNHTLNAKTAPELLFDPTEIRGYDREADIFFYEPNGGADPWSWKRIKKAAAKPTDIIVPSVSWKVYSEPNPVHRNTDFMNHGSADVRVKVKPIVDQWYRILRLSGHLAQYDADKYRDDIKGK